ncbi:MAG: hypothetical protein JWM59_2099 [Verrucomicrobiales bacterium]|nr:hypothetical protein [Verrucomicrobiales bacterium]
MKHFLYALLAGLLFIGAASADTNKKCPVSGKDVDPAHTTTVKVTVGFCCSKCQAKFEGDAKLKEDAIQKYAGSKDSPVNTKCPVSGKDIAKENTATAEKTVAFCCPKCKTAFEADPKKYIAKVK